MNALILAAGLGTRLAGITKNKQKCMLPIKGKPLLLYWIEALNNLGADKIFINNIRLIQSDTNPSVSHFSHYSLSPTK